MFLVQKDNRASAQIPSTTHLNKRKPVRKLKFQTIYHKAALVAAQQVKSVIRMICVEENSQAWLCFRCELVLSSVANKGSHSSEDTTGSQAAVKQEAEPLTAQRRRELEHYLKLKRYRSFFLFSLELAEVLLSPTRSQFCLFDCADLVGFTACHLFLFLSQGWLQDRSGQWVKDENVEFDSDEEEPPSPAPQPEGHWEN